MTIIKKTYTEQKDGESLTARLIEEGERSIEIAYQNARGDRQIGVYKDGKEILTIATMVNRTPSPNSPNGTYIPRYLTAYNQLGPRLKKQIPSDWHAVLGKWLEPRRKRRS